MLKTIKTNSAFPITVEPHPEDYNGYPFITLIKFNQTPNITIVDNLHKKYLDAYCLDLCSSRNVNERTILKVANYWYHTNRNNYPISIEFSKRGLMDESSKILKSYPIEYITRIIGPVMYFNMAGTPKIRKRKRKSPYGYEVVITSQHFKSIITKDHY